MKRQLLTILILALCLAGCMTGHQAAYDGVSSVYPAAVVQIAQDAANHLAGAYPPGQTSLAINTDSSFGQALEVALRQRGFTVADSGIPVSYQLDMLQNEATPACYLALRLPDGTFTRSYTLSAGTVVADSAAKTGSANFSEAPALPPPGVLPPATPISPSAVAGYSMDTDTRDLASGMTKHVTLTVKKDGMPVQSSVPVRFEEAHAYPNLRSITRVTDARGQITLKGLRIEDNSVPLTATVNGQPGVQCSMSSYPAQVRPVPKVEAALASLGRPTTPLAPVAMPHNSQPTPIQPIASPAPMSTTLSDEWHVRPGLMRAQLESWSARAGYQVVWNPSADYELHSSAVFRGTFINAVDKLFTRLHMHGNPLRVSIYEANQVVEVNED